MVLTPRPKRPPWSLFTGAFAIVLLMLFATCYFFYSNDTADVGDGSLAMQGQTDAASAPEGGLLDEAEAGALGHVTDSVPNAATARAEYQRAVASAAISQDILPGMTWIESEEGLAYISALESPIGDRRALVVFDLGPPRSYHRIAIQNLSDESLQFVDTEATGGPTDVISMAWAQDGEALYLLQTILPEERRAEFASGQSEKGLFRRVKDLRNAQRLLLSKWDGQTGEARTIASLDMDNIFDMSVSDDGAVYLATGARSADGPDGYPNLFVIKVDSDGTNERRAYSTGGYHNARVLPNREELWFTGPRPGVEGAADIYRINTARPGSQPELAVRNARMITWSDDETTMAYYTDPTTGGRMYTWNALNENTLDVGDVTNLPSLSSLGDGGEILYFYGIQNGYLSGPEVVRGDTLRHSGMYRMELSAAK